MNKIIKLTKNEFDSLIKTKKVIGEASSESIIYDLNNGFILKDLKDESLLDFKTPEELVYNEKDLLKFSDIEVKSYFFVKKIIYADNDLRACIMRKCSGYVVNYIDPLSVNLSLLSKAIESFKNDTKKISEKHILGYDMMSNFMFDGIKFGAIDTIHYTFSDLDENKIFEDNIYYFNIEILRFLTELYFKDFVKQDKELNEMFESLKNNKYTDLNAYIRLFIKKLSEYCGVKILYLKDADKAIKENNNMIYPYCPVYKLKK